MQRCLSGYGLEIVARVPLMCPATTAKPRYRYLRTRRDLLGHLLRHVHGDGGPLDEKATT